MQSLCVRSTAGSSRDVVEGTIIDIFKIGVCLCFQIYIHVVRPNDITDVAQED